MANKISNLRKSIYAQREELKKAIGDELTTFVTHQGNVYNLPKPQKVLTSSPNITIYSLFNICNLDPDLVVVRRINNCANFNVIRYADMSSEDAVALYDVIRNIHNTPVAKETPVVENTKTQIHNLFLYTNLEYKDGKAYLYKSMATGIYVLLPCDYKIHPITGETGCFGETEQFRKVFPNPVNINDYQYDESTAEYIQGVDEEGVIFPIKVYSIEYKGKIYHCRYALNDEGDIVIVAPESLNEQISADNYEGRANDIDNEIAFYADDELFKLTYRKFAEELCNSQCADYFLNPNTEEYDFDLIS